MSPPGAGRFAPSPTGELHLGNLRTALVAWLFARTRGLAFLLRYEDLDTAVVRPESYASQRRDLELLGLDFDEPELRQSDRLEAYADVVAELERRDLVFRCWCSRREIREAAQAPNEPLPPGAYPGTCRHLSRAELAEREASGRPPALRLRTGGELVEFHDELCGPVDGFVDDLVLVRNDGTYAYNLVVVVDDDHQGVTQVVRADDLVSSTPRHIHLARVLGLDVPTYAHVPLVLGPDGQRLAKRHGAVTLPEQLAAGHTVAGIVGALAASLGLVPPGTAVTPGELLAEFAPERLGREPWVLHPESDLDR